MTLKKFRYMDMIALSLLAIISEFLGTFLIGKISTGFFLSFASMIAIIATIRWGVVGAITFVLSGIPLVFIENLDYLQGFAYYVLANCFIAIPILLYGKRNRDIIVRKTWGLFTYILLCFVFLSIGKGLVIFLVDDKITGILEFFGSMILTMIVDMILCYIFTKKKTDLICDMREYLKRVALEEDN